MKAFVTGASSGIGYEIAKYLSELGYDIIAVARHREGLDRLRKEAKTLVETYGVDLSSEKNCIDLFNRIGNYDIDVVVNDAGSGVYGKFDETDLEKELQMIRTNISALHILTKLFLAKMVRADKGYIMNVSSLAGFMPGPRMAAYFATKAYVTRLTQAVQQELAEKHSKVHVCVLCPTAVGTNFENIAGVKFGVPQQCPDYVAKYAVDAMFQKKKMILPGCGAKAAKNLSKILPDSLNARVASAMMHAEDEKEVKRVDYISAFSII